MKKVNCLICGKDTSPSFLTLNYKIKCVKCIEKLKIDVIYGKNGKYEYYSIYKYNDFIKYLIWEYKFKNKVEFKNVFFEDIKFFLENYINIDEYTLISAPTSMEKLKSRGFNPSFELFSYFEVIDPFLRIDNISMHKIKSDERSHVKHEYLRKNNIKIDKNKPIFILDDIVTSKTTFKNLANFLESDGYDVKGLITLISSH